MRYRLVTVPLLLGDIAAQMKVHIWEPDTCNKAVFCVHGFAGTGQDFEMLAKTLTNSGFRVVAPDIVGRGQSSFLGDPKLYGLRTYIRCLTALTQFGRAKNYHLGTSWGGAILLAYLASSGWNTSGLVLNDIPLKSDTNLKAFRAFLAEEAKTDFSSREAAADHILKTRSMEFLTGEEREKFIQSRTMAVGDVWRLRYDPSTTAAFGSRSSFSFEKMLKEIDHSVLMTFGNKSPYVDRPALADLTKTNKNLQVIMDMDDPHPPSLMKLGQILQIAGFLAQAD